MDQIVSDILGMADRYYESHHLAGLSFIRRLFATSTET